MYLNDHSRTEFYESIGLNTTQFNMHVIHQTNKTTASIFPQVIDTYNPKFKEHLDELVVVNQKLAKAESPVEKAPLIASLIASLNQRIAALILSCGCRVVSRSLAMIVSSFSTPFSSPWHS